MAPTGGWSGRERSDVQVRQPCPIALPLPARLYETRGDDAIVRPARHHAARNRSRMPPLHDAITPWHEFYNLLGTASATMVALLFVAASIGTGIFTGQIAPLRVFLSASVVNFGIIL